MKEQLTKNWSLFLIASLTLGLAPFNPPHLVGKIKWILGGNAFSGEFAMQSQDWFDVLLHGLPVLLFVSVALNIIQKRLSNFSINTCAHLFFLMRTFLNLHTLAFHKLCR